MEEREVTGVLDQLRKTMLAGLGVVFFTREKVEEAIGNLVRGGHLSREQGTKILDELAARGKQGKEEFVSRMVEKWGPLLESIKPVSQREFEELRARVEALERRLGNEPPAPPDPI